MDYADDISDTITAKSDQLNACDLFGGPITVKVTAVNVCKTSDQPVSIQVGDDRQPFKPCLTVRRILAKLWGPKSAVWVGKSMTLYCNDSVMWAGQAAGGIRVSHLEGINEPRDITVRTSKHKTTTYTILPLVISPAYTDDHIKENGKLWAVAFQDGKTTPARLIAKIKQAYTLTPEQERLITNLKTVEAAHDD